VERGRGLVAACDPGRGDGLRDANRRRNGAPFLYADGLIMAAAAIRTALRIPYRQLSGMPESMLDGRASPSYPVPCRRMQRPDVEVGGGTATVRDPDRRLVMVADATGLKQHRRGERVRHKWRMRRGFAKLHLPMDADTRQVLAAAVTGEKAGDAAQLPALLHTAVGEDRLPGAGEAGGGYASRANAAECARLDVTPDIRLPASRTARGRGSGDAWGLLLRRQQGGGPREAVGCLPREERLENLRYRRSTVGYGTRWLAGTVISATRRMFGEDVMALKWPNMVREVAMRLALYNRWAAEAAAA